MLIAVADRRSTNLSRMSLGCEENREINILLYLNQIFGQDQRKQILDP